jgi:REP element-mobilizing transposase RayT
MLDREARQKVSAYLRQYAEEKTIYLKLAYVNADHVHALIDLPTGMTIEQVVQLLKGASSHWINEQALVPGKFAWGRGYGAFSVSQSAVETVAQYIAGQEEHHRLKTFEEEYAKFVEAYGLKWKREETVETVSSSRERNRTPLKRGVNENDMRNPSTCRDSRLRGAEAGCE